MLKTFTQESKIKRQKKTAKHKTTTRQKPNKQIKKQKEKRRWKKQASVKIWNALNALIGTAIVCASSSWAMFSCNTFRFSSIPILMNADVTFEPRLFFIHRRTPQTYLFQLLLHMS